MIGQPYFKVTFFHSVLYPTGVVVPAPLGWRNASISLERHKDYHSLIEYFKGSFVWYGKAREVIREVEDLDGPDGVLRCLIEVSFGGAFETIFDGLIDISQQEDISKGGSFYKQQAPIISNSFWSKFINRKDISVDLQANVDLDGNARTPVSKIVLPLPSQVIRNRSVWTGQEGLSGVETGVVNAEKFAQLGLPRTIGEIKDSFEIGFAERPSNLAGIINVIEVKEQGDIVFNVTGTATIEASSDQSFDFSQASLHFLRVGADNQNVNIVQQASESGTAIDRTFDMSGQVTLNAEIGDLVYIYIRWNASHEDVGPTIGNIIYNYSLDLSIEAIQNSTMPDTTTDAYLIGDAAESILSKITGKDNVLVSDALTTGCERLRAIMRGKHVRGWSFDEKEFFMKFDDWWAGAAKQLPLGLGHTSTDQIEIEPIEYFYDKDFTVTFDNVSDLVRTYDLDKIFKSVQIGFSKWSSESDSGIDDPQTKRGYRTRFQSIGQEIQILSKWIAASLAIERSRRNRVELGKDDRNDEEIFCINVLEDYYGGYVPEFDENFDSITGLLNSDKRYNVRETPARMLLRWRSFLQGCLQHTTGESFYFADGEGNYEMSSDISDGDCEAGSVAENQDIPVTSDFILIPKVYKFSAPMDLDKWKAILANKKKAIGISRGTTGHVPVFIMNLDYFMSQRRGEFLVILGEDTTI